MPPAIDDHLAAAYREAGRPLGLLLELSEEPTPDGWETLREMAFSFRKPWKFSRAAVLGEATGAVVAVLTPGVETRGFDPEHRERAAAWAVA